MSHNPFAVNLKKRRPLNGGSHEETPCAGKDKLRKTLAGFNSVSWLTDFMTMQAQLVNREQSPQELFAAVGRKQYVNTEMVATIPRQAPAGVAANQPLVFFDLDLSERGGCSDTDLEKEYEARGLVADPYYQFNVNREHPDFADEYPNACHWKDAEGKWCFAAFGRGDGERCIRVGRSGTGWGVSWWFAGRRKS